MWLVIKAWAYQPQQQGDHGVGRRKNLRNKHEAETAGN